MSDLQSRMRELPASKRSKLELLLQKRAPALEKDPILPGSGGARPPASFSQQRLWFLDQWQPNTPAYNSAAAIRIEGRLDAAALDGALTEIVRRHETLRTTFAAPDGDPVQVVHPPSTFAAERVDLTAIPKHAWNAEVYKYFEELLTRPFDLVRSPLFRPVLLQLNPDAHVFAWSIHHIISDGWSIGVLQRELSILYEAFANGRPSPLSELQVQYADFAAWQRRRLQGEFMATALHYWREQLRDAPVLDLPADHPRPPMQTFNGSTVPFHAPKSTIEDLKLIGRTQGASLFMALLAAFKTLLHRYTGQDDITVGTPIAGRMRVELEPLIGFFANTLALRTDVSGDPSYRDLLRRVQEVALAAYGHQETPFEKLVEEVHPHRDPSRNPLFQILFVLQNTPKHPLSLPGLKVERVEISRRNIRFDLEVHVWEAEDGLRGLFIYNTALFEGERIRRMAKHLRTLLQGAAANPDERLSRLPLLDDEEKQQLLYSWNQTRTDYPRDACIHQLFDIQAAAAPDRPAVEFDGRQLTYAQLSGRANRLAHRLKAWGVGPDVVVGVCVKRSIDMVVAFLAILKAGGAYAPLDPSYPRDRLAFMIQDATASILLTQERWISSLPAENCRVVALDSDSFEDEPSTSPHAGTTAENLAYVIYTSGSTGKPKGVAVPHRGVVRLVRNTNYVRFDASERVAQTSNAAFDIAGFEIWGALLSGAALIGVPQEVLLAPEEFAQYSRTQKITTVSLTTALFNQIANDRPAAFEPFRYVFVVGEAFDPKPARKVLQAGPPQQLVNAYGPTESTGYATTYRIESLSDAAITVPIGRPISNTTAYVLDGNLQPVPIGVTGELCLGGDGLAREYLNRPELTAEKFIRDPFSEDPSARLYRTGDLVRYLDDGNIDFLGRLDQQVKIRGFRIELEEIEATISRFPGVKMCAVVAKNRNGDKHLIAYIVPAENDISTEDLQHFLRQTLPEYMLPSAFVRLDMLPITSNGKLDHAALPEPDVDRPAGRFVAPRTPMEACVAEIWEELLGIERVGAEDHFFDLGGHSLLVIRMIARIRSRFGCTLPLAAVFQSATVAEVARLIEAALNSAPATSVQPPETPAAAPPRKPFLHSIVSNITRILRNARPDWF